MKRVKNLRVKRLWFRINSLLLVLSMLASLCPSSPIGYTASAASAFQVRLNLDYSKYGYERSSAHYNEYNPCDMTIETVGWAVNTELTSEAIINNTGTASPRDFKLGGTGLQSLVYQDEVLAVDFPATDAGYYRLDVTIATNGYGVKSANVGVRNGADSSEQYAGNVNCENGIYNTTSWDTHNMTDSPV